MKQVIVTKDCKGSINGIDVINFKAGSIVSLPISLADAFVNHMGTAKYKEIGPSVTNEVKEIKNQESNPVTYDNFESDDLESEHWQKIRKMVLAKGGKWVNRDEGIKFLRG